MASDYNSTISLRKLEFSCQSIDKCYQVLEHSGQTYKSGWCQKGGDPMQLQGWYGWKAWLAGFEVATARLYYQVRQFNISIIIIVMHIGTTMVLGQ